MSGEHLVEFTPTSDNVRMLKDLLKDQGVAVCRNEISSEWIGASVRKHEYGFARFTDKTSFGRRNTRRSGDRYQLWGFVLCSVQPFDDESVDIDLVCARPASSGTGELLLEMAENKARTLGARYTKLLCLPHQRLKQYYERLGYRCRVLQPPGSNVKIYEMIKRLQDS